MIHSGLAQTKEKRLLKSLPGPLKHTWMNFLQQLLTAELNIETFRGARNENGILNEGFNRAMLIYAEAVACREIGTCPAESSSSEAVKTETKRVSTSDTQMLSSFNGSGGI